MNQKIHEELESPLVRQIIIALEDKKAIDIRALDVRNVASYTDTLILCSGSSSTHVAALAQTVEDEVDERPVYITNSPNDSWCVLDYIDVVVHVQREDIREHYGLEALWSDAQEIHIDGPLIISKTVLHRYTHRPIH